MQGFVTKRNRVEEVVKWSFVDFLLIKVVTAVIYGQRCHFRDDIFVMPAKIQ